MWPVSYWSFVKTNDYTTPDSVTNFFSLILPIPSFLGQKPKVWSICQQQMLGNIKRPEGMWNNDLLAFKPCKQNSKIPNIKLRNFGIFDEVSKKANDAIQNCFVHMDNTWWTIRLPSSVIYTLLVQKWKKTGQSDLGIIGFNPRFLGLI